MWINQTATFTCATNVAGYAVNFDIPGAVEQISSSPLPGGGQKTTATFTATLDTNGTNVTYGAVDDFIVLNTTEVVQVYIQGQLIYEIVSNKSVPALLLIN